MQEYGPWNIEDPSQMADLATIILWKPTAYRHQGSYAESTYIDPAAAVEDKIPGEKSDFAMLFGPIGLAR
ncbi:hypothetical protein N7475_009579 [Penicillium sp. IBT 31633x]|nr:hypothetical protein N7475_009579 [Penicillium sp. IBT 31633x]